MTLIELLGISRAGKTTQIEFLAKSFEKQGKSYSIFKRPNIPFKHLGNLERFHLFFYEQICGAYDDYIANGVDFLIFDRGFYDRLVMLEADYDSYEINEDFRNNLSDRFIEKLPLVDYPLMLMVNSKNSLKRWKQQKQSGLDNSKLNDGLNSMDDLGNLKYLSKLYLGLNRRYPQIREINANLSMEKVTSEIEVAFMGKIKVIT